MQDAATALTVGDLVRRIQSTLKADDGLRDVWVRGEISGFNRHHASGHIYLDLKDRDANLPCAFFRGANRHLDFEPDHGMRVLARGDVEVYVQRGRVQLIVREMRPDGDGDLAARLEALKRALAAEGLFDAHRKRPIPPMPLTIGIVTSPGGAALRDMLHVLDAEAPYARVVIAGARVQGDGAAEEVAAAIARLNKMPADRRPEVILVARGGGSLEDLMAFNEEAVVRAIAASEVPVVAGVGHETDVTLADLAADQRAPTPTAAAKRVAPGADEVAAWVDERVARMRNALTWRLGRARERVDALTRRGPLADPERLLARYHQRVDDLAGRLDALSPLATLGRGYAVARAEDGRVVRAAAEVAAGDRLSITFRDGRVDTSVRAVHPETKKKEDLS